MRDTLHYEMGDFKCRPKIACRNYCDESYSRITLRWTKEDDYLRIYETH